MESTPLGLRLALIVYGLGGIWRFAQATSLQVRFLNFYSGKDEGVTSAGRFDLSVAHAVWARQRLLDGWKYGPERSDARKEHPGLVPYDQLTEVEKQYDRNAALETLKAILALGYRIEPPSQEAADKRGVGAPS